MINRSIKIVCITILTAVFLLSPFTLSFGNDAPRITKEELKSIMNNAEVAIIDVRKGRDWSSSEFKIKGAVYGDPRQIAKWNDKYSKDQKLVLYCA
jgi:rhodanese-related sulfurtransferase